MENYRIGSAIFTKSILRYMMKFFFAGLSFFIIIFILPAGIFAQDDDGESPEMIKQRFEYITTRRVGGPGKTLPPFAYQIAMEQKKNIVDISSVLEHPYDDVGWVSVNPNGMFYNRNGVSYISGRTNSMAFHPSDPNIIYIATAQGGVWKTTNGGTNWTAMTDGLSTLSGGDIVIDPVNPNIIYYASGEANFSVDSQYGDGIFKSTDAGVTWNKIATTAQVGSYIAQICVDPTNTQVIYAAGTSGVFKTTNGGTAWSNTGAGTYGVSLILDPVNTQILYLGTLFGLVKKSTNGGTSWTTLTTGLPSTNAQRTQLAMAPSNNLILYACIENASTSAMLGLYKTTDAGTTWTTAATSPNPLGGQGWYDNSITVHNTDPNIVVVAGLDLYVSTNGGTTLTKKTDWASVSAGNFSHADVHRLAYNGTVLYCASDGGFYKSTNNGNNWSDLNRTISSLQFQSADYDPTNILKIYGGCQDNDKEYTTNGGTDWIQRTTGDGGYTIVDPVNTNYIYSQYVNGTLYRSGNSGVSFSSIAPSGSTGGLFYNPFEMAPGDHNTIIYCEGDVWKTTSAQTASTFGGWSQLATTATVGGSVSAIGISTTTTNKIYIGTSNGRILVTTNNGANWSLSTGYNYVSDFAVDPVDDNIAYATFGGTSSTVRKTTNGGNTWSVISTGLPSIAANSIILKTSGTRILIIGMDAGVYASTNEGTNWYAMNTNLPNVEVYDLKYHESAGVLLAATHGRGVWTFADAPLPVLLVYFNSSVAKRSVLLSWATQQEINNRGFEIEREDLNNASAGWIKAGFIEGSGTTSETKYYSFSDDKLVSSRYNYRLKQIDNNGNYEYHYLSSSVDIGVPGKSELSQNYPNPFNPLTKIDYDIAADDIVNIAVYDVTGKLVKQIVNEFKQAGYYTAEFDASNLASGVYFYKLISGNYTHVKRMLVVK